MSDDLRNQFDRMIEAGNRVSAILILKDKIQYAFDGGKRECGSCNLWMTRSCPYERNVNGRNQGPSMSHPACGKFARTASSINIQRGRIEDAIAFALEHDLPVPQLEVAQ